ncbi:MAG: hypothetical protein WC445_01840 [Patescibacteria group bacterium]
MNQRIYLIIAIVVAVLAISVAGYFYWQGGVDKEKLAITRDDLARTENELQRNIEELDRLRNLIDQSLEKAKFSASLLKDSSETFLVAGDIKVASLGSSEVEEIEAQIKKLTDKQDKIALENLWSDFVDSRTISDYLAFSRFLTDRIKNNLENIH